MENRIRFEGEPPFLMLTIQTAQADAIGGAVLLTLYASIDGEGPDAVPVIATLPPLAALALSKQLADAVKLAESQRALSL